MQNQKLKQPITVSYHFSEAQHIIDDSIRSVCCGYYWTEIRKLHHPFRSSINQGNQFTMECTISTSGVVLR